MKQAFAIFPLLLLVVFSFGCGAEIDDMDTDPSSELEESELEASEIEKSASLGQCPGTVRALTSSDPEPWANGLKYTQYLYDPTYRISVYGTAGVDQTKMKQTCWVTTKLITALNPEYRPAMLGYKVHLKVLSDSPGGGASSDGNSMHVERQCGSLASDWANLVHEFGHSVLMANGLHPSMDEAWKRYSDPARYAERYASEYFPWAVENWFEVRTVGARASMPAWERRRVGRIFDAETFFTPKCQ
jgi:hypothetical protein